MPRSPLKVLLAPFGSEGDVNPLLWIGRALAKNGHEPHVLLTDNYTHLAERAGLPWSAIPLGAEGESLARDPRIWDPRTGSFFVGRFMLSSFPIFLEHFRGITPRPDLVIYSTLALAAGFGAESEKIPRISVHMQPTVLRSLGDCPMLGQGMEWLPAAPAWGKRLFFRAMDAFLDTIFLPPLNRLRSGLGLPKGRRAYNLIVPRETPSALLAPEWFAPPQPDWPTGMKQFGFPLAGNPGEDLAPAIAEFLEAGDPPILWTHGSANYATEHFATCAAQVSERLGTRAILVGPEPPRADPPENMLYSAHAPFAKLLPRCRAVVHHGGIGTTAQSCAAGIPQLVVPRAHDQPDNARRIGRLGLGLHLPYTKFHAENAKSALSSLLADGTIAKKCRARADAFSLGGEEDRFASWAEAIAVISQSWDIRKRQD